MARKRRMEGRRVKWILGTDHAGIATQSVVEKELRSQGISRHDLGREAFVEKVWEWRAEYGKRIIGQFERLGASCDYEDERFTLDDGYVKAVLPRLQAALRQGLHLPRQLPRQLGPGLAFGDLRPRGREPRGDRHALLDRLPGRGLRPGAHGRHGAAGDDAGRRPPLPSIPTDDRYTDLVGGHCILPIVGRRLPIIADPYVDIEFGTGALKITPGHDPNDFEIGRAHGLEEISVIGEDGRIIEPAPERFVGMPADEALDAVDRRAARRRQHLGRGGRTATRSPYSHRSGERIEPLISLQWFCRRWTSSPSRRSRSSKATRSGLTPERWKTRLSRLDGGNPALVRLAPALVGPPAAGLVLRCLREDDRRGDRAGVLPGLRRRQLRRDPDVLDTWFSSALWPFATLGWPEGTPELRAFYPTDLLSTARDIIYLWVARMIMSGLEFTGEIPFHDVYIHSVIQAPDGRRMSKSLGTGIDPLDEIDKHGADALRFGLLAMSSSQDVRFSEAKVQQGRDLANKMWNASRLILLNAAEAPGARPEPRPETPEDRWILSRLERAIAEIGSDLDSYDFAHAALELYRFFWSELCDWYLEIVKPRLYDGDEAAASNLLHVLERTLALAHPIMPFVTEEIWSYLPDRSAQLVVSAFPEADASRIDEEAEAEVEAAIDLTRDLRRWRELADVAPGAILSGRSIEGEPPAMVGRLARFDFAAAASSDGRGEAIATVGTVEVLPSEELDAAAVESRLEERRSKLRSEVERGERKLGNEGFVAKAPPEVVEEERGKLAAYRAELEELGG